MQATIPTYTKICIIMQSPITKEDFISVSQIQRKVDESRTIDCTICMVNGYDDIAALVQQQLLAGNQLMVVYGDEATIAEVATNLYLGGIPLGILPSGRSQAVMHRLGIRTTIDSMLNAICSGIANVTWLDLAQIDDILFFGEITIQSESRHTTSSKHSLPVCSTLKTFQLELDGAFQQVTGTSIIIISGGIIDLDDRQGSGWLRIHVCNDTATGGQAASFKARKMVVKTEEKTSVTINRSKLQRNFFQIESISKAIPLITPTMH